MNGHEHSAAFLERQAYLREQARNSRYAMICLRIAWAFVSVIALAGIYEWALTR